MIHSPRFSRAVPSQDEKKMPGHMGTWAKCMVPGVSGLDMGMGRHHSCVRGKFSVLVSLAHHGGCGTPERLTNP